MKSKKAAKADYPTPQSVMGEAIEHLRGRHREVYLLTVRDGKSLKEAARVLRMSQFSVEIYQNQAIRHVEEYCKNAMAKGRI